MMHSDLCELSWNNISGDPLHEWTLYSRTTARICEICFAALTAPRSDLRKTLELSTESDGQITVYEARKQLNEMDQT